MNGNLTFCHCFPYHKFRHNRITKYGTRLQKLKLHFTFCMLQSLYINTCSNRISASVLGVFVEFCMDLYECVCVTKMNSLFPSKCLCINTNWEFSLSRSPSLSRFYFAMRQFVQCSQMKSKQDWNKYILQICVYRERSTQ